MVQYPKDFWGVSSLTHDPHHHRGFFHGPVFQLGVITPLSYPICHVYRLPLYMTLLAIPLGVAGMVVWCNLWGYDSMVSLVTLYGFSIVI